MKDQRNTSAILGIASAFPRLYSQEDVRNALCSNYKFTSDTLDFMHRVFNGTKFDSCAVAADPSELGKKMTRTEYVKYIKRNLLDLSVKAAEDAISSWGRSTRDVTHLVFGTMTQSIHAPTMDVELAIALGLPNDTKRLNIEGMGCLTGFRCLALGASIAESDPQARVLVICSDIRSALMNQMPEYPTRKHLVTAALFRDSSGAVILGQQNQNMLLSRNETPIYSIRNHESYLIPNSFDIVSLTENDSSEILLDLSKELPAVVCQHTKHLVDKLLAGHDVDVQQADFALHTGGPRIIQQVAQSLGMTDHGRDNMRSSWEVMQKYGNLSGSSNLVVLHHILERDLEGKDETSKRNDVICMSMGPGMAVEALLLKRVRDA